MLTVGEILKSQRETKNIQLTDVEKQIKVRAKFLQAIENNNWNYFSSKIYITGIIQNYADYLELDPKKMLAFFRRDYERKEDVRFKRRIASSYLSSETRRIVISALVGIFIIFFGYFGYQLKNYFSPPAVKFVSPKINQFTTETSVKIVGQTEKDAMITVLGERVYQNKEGVFEYDFPLHDGKNEFVLELTGANGKKATVKEYYYRTPPQ